MSGTCAPCTLPWLQGNMGEINGEGPTKGVVGMKELSVRPETIKILEDNTGSNVCNTGHGNSLLAISPEARKIKAKINYWDYTKIKSLCSVKETISSTKRQPME